MNTAITNVPIVDDSVGMSPSDLFNPSCACQQWLVSKESDHCRLCKRCLPMVAAYQLECFETNKSLASARHQLSVVLNTQAQQQGTIESQTKAKKDMQEDLEQRKRDIESLRQDLEVLSKKYAGEILQQKEIKSSKDCVKREIEELSLSLREEAGRMVVSEQKQIEKLGLSHKRLLQQLVNTEETLFQVEEDLRLLRVEISQITRQHSEEMDRSSDDSARLQSVDPGAYTLRARLDLTSMTAVLLQQQNSEGVQVNITEEDPSSLIEYRELKEGLATVPFHKIGMLPYMKQCLKYDIVPCLRFGASSKVSSRKIIQAIIRSTCSVDKSPEGYVQEQMEKHRQQQSEMKTKTGLWERLSVTHAPFGCYTCGRKVDMADVADTEILLPFRFRLSHEEDWWCIDSYCRDRLTAAIDFYAHIRQLQQGAFHAYPLTVPYQLCCQLRLQMFLSRMGALQLFKQ